MDEDLEQHGIKMMNNEVPLRWTEEKGCGFLSVKPLANWIQDLIYRIDFMRRWELCGTPECYWLSGFFFPQAFMTGIKQNYARKYKISIDLIDFDFELLNNKHSENDISNKPEDGCYVSGL